MKDMTAAERKEWLNDFINHWINCYGCGPLVGACSNNINGFTISGDKAVFVETSEDIVTFALYSEDGEKVAEYHLYLESGAAVMVANKTLGETEYTSHYGIISDITAGMFNDYYGDAPFVLVNEPVRIDITAPVVKPMSMEEIFADIVKKISEEKEEEEEWE